MKQLKHLLLELRFILLLLAVLVGIDLVLTALAPVEQSTLFPKNDYERAVISHDGKTSFDKVLWGNSVAGAGYLEDCSQSGYVNFGIVYGTMLDLEAELTKGYFSPGTDLVVMVNYLTFSVIISTDPSYPWHRLPLEPYVYFQRDRLMTAAENTAKSLLETHSLSGITRYTDLSRSECHGSLSDDELDQIITAQTEQYYNKDLSYYKKNFAATRRIIDYCQQHGIRLRVLCAPLNPYYTFDGYPAEVMDEAITMFQESGIDILDMRDAIDREGFYDLGHLNREVGAVQFTNAIEEWLCQ